MQKISAGFGAGFIATVVLSALMIGKGMMGMMPALNVIDMLSHMMGAPMFTGWLAHFFIGTIAWGAAFALLYERIPTASAASKGIVFAIGAWLAMMVLVMPLAGAGLFGLKLGLMAPVATLVLHIIYGAVLGVAFRALNAPRAVRP